jgi:MFS family permease
MMVQPFYIVFAKTELNAPPESVGWFILAQVLGGLPSNLLWAKLVDKYGSKRMLGVCAVMSTVAPLLAVCGSSFGWQGLLPVFLITGASFNGRKVGFSSALLEIAPETERPTYSALNSVLILPVAFLSLAAGIMLNYYSYGKLFIFAAFFTGIGGIMTTMLPKNSTHL